MGCVTSQVGQPLFRWIHHGAIELTIASTSAPSNRLAILYVIDDCDGFVDTKLWATHGTNEFRSSLDNAVMVILASPICSHCKNLAFAVSPSSYMSEPMGYCQCYRSWSDSDEPLRAELVLSVGSVVTDAEYENGLVDSFVPPKRLSVRRSLTA